MNKSLLNSIYSSIKNSVSASTTNVYYEYLPDAELLKTFTVTYEIRESIVENSYSGKEEIVTYQLDIKLNNPNTGLIIDNIQKIKRGIYDIILSTVIDKRFINSDIFFDDELNIYTATLRFELDFVQPFIAS